MELLKKIILACLKGYQMTHIFRPPACRFYPSCSKYSSEAISRHGIMSGVFLTIVRVSKCQPFHPGGLDEVPEKVLAGFKSREFLLRLLDRGALT